MNDNNEIFAGILAELNKITNQVKALMIPEKEVIEMEHADRYGFKLRHLEKEFNYQGLTLKIYRFDPERKKACIVQDVNTKKTYQLRPALVHSLVSSSELEEDFEIATETFDFSGDKDKEDSLMGLRLQALRNRVKTAVLWKKGCQFASKLQLVALLNGTKTDRDQIYKEVEVKMAEIYE